MKIASAVLTAVGTKILANLGNSLSKKKGDDHASSSIVRNGGGKMKELPPGEHGDSRVPSSNRVKRSFFSKGKK